MPEKPKVFISHSSEDNEISHKIATDLDKDGAEIWIDQIRLRPGESLTRRISDALEWCDTLVLLWSKSAKMSDWVNREWENAEALKKRIIPCLLDGIPLPGMLCRYLYVDFRNPEIGYPHLARALNLSIKPAAPKIKPVPAEPIVAAISEPPQTAGKLLQRSPFRSEPRDLSDADVKAILAEKNFFDSDWNKNGAGFTHQYSPQTIANDRVVIDLASGLMWQHGGSDSWMNFETAQEWMNDLNKKGYAGFKDWRLPTLEEAMSLMEREKKNGDLYLDPVFDAVQWWIWTADTVDGAAAAWVVYFNYGYCTRISLDDNYFVRAVRSGQASQE